MMTKIKYLKKSLRHLGISYDKGIQFATNFSNKIFKHGEEIAQN